MSVKLSTIAGLLWLTAMPAVADDAFDQQVRDTLLRNPQIMLEVFAILEKQNDERERRADALLIETARDDLFGNGADGVGSNAPVVVEFVDYQCAYCRRAESELQKLKDSNPEIVIKVIQLPILGDQSVELARIALAAKELYGEESYLALNDAFLQGGETAVHNVDRFLEAMGYDAAALRLAADGDDIEQELVTAHGLARRLQISGTPGFVTRTQIHRGFVAAQELAESALRPINAEVASQ